MLASKWIFEVLDLGLQMHLQTRSISASKCISELLHLGLQMHLQMHLQTRSISASKSISECNSISASKCISKPARDRPPSASTSSTRSRPPSESANLLDHGLQVHLSVHTITASKCISTFSQSSVSRCLCDYAPASSAARLAVCIYVE
jgi:hypothetical protein